MDIDYVADLLALAEDFEAYFAQHGPGDPDGSRHRQDDPATVAEMEQGRGA